MVFFFLNARGPLGGGLVFYAGRCIACACGSWLLVSVCARWLGGPLLLAPLPSTAVGGDTGDGCGCTARPMAIYPESIVPDDGCAAPRRVYGAVAMKKSTKEKKGRFSWPSMTKKRGGDDFFFFCSVRGQGDRQKTKNRRGSAKGKSATQSQTKRAPTSWSLCQKRQK